MEYNTSSKIVALLKTMDEYLHRLIEFRAQMESCEVPVFAEVMNASANDIGTVERKSRLADMRKMLRELFICKQDLFKLPLFFVIDKYSAKPTQEKMTYEQWSAFIFLYYIYMFMFARMAISKSREELPKKFMRHLSNNDDFLDQFIATLRDCYQRGNNNSPLKLDVGMLRRKDGTREQLYQILDYFDIKERVDTATNTRFLSYKMQLFPPAYNVEHLIIAQSHKIVWISKDYDETNPQTDTKHEFNRVDFNGCAAWDAPNNHFANFIWIDSGFNRDELKDYDIITKVLRLRGSCDKGVSPCRNTYAKKHPHIEVFCQQIMNTDGFEELLQDHNNNASREIVKAHYRTFLNNYFSESNVEELCHRLNTQFTDTLNNLFAQLT